jgi:hypothetical protein
MERDIRSPADARIEALENELASLRIRLDSTNIEMVELRSVMLDPERDFIDEGKTQRAPYSGRQSYIDKEWTDGPHSLGFNANGLIELLDFSTRSQYLFPYVKSEKGQSMLRWTYPVSFESGTPGDGEPLMVTNVTLVQPSSNTLRIDLKHRYLFCHEGRLDILTEATEEGDLITLTGMPTMTEITVITAARYLSPNLQYKTRRVKVELVDGEDESDWTTFATAAVCPTT